MAARKAVEQGFKEFYMKKIAMIAVVLVMALAAVSARDKIVSADQLPKTAQDFISAHFAGKTVQYVEMDFNEFEVQLSDRTEIEFGGNGEWESVKSYEIYTLSLHDALPILCEEEFCRCKDCGGRKGLE